MSENISQKFSQAINAHSPDGASSRWYDQIQVRDFGADVRKWLGEYHAMPVIDSTLKPYEYPVYPAHPRDDSALHITPPNQPHEYPVFSVPALPPARSIADAVREALEGKRELGAVYAARTGLQRYAPAKPSLVANIPIPAPNKPCPICMQHPSDPHKTWCRHWRIKAPDASGEAVAALVPQPKEAAARFDCKRAA